MSEASCLQALPFNYREDFDLAGRVVVVTGAAQGIGMNVASYLSSAGAKVVLADINGAGAEKSANEIGNGAVGLQVDVSNDTSTIDMAKMVAGSFGRIDVLVNNAAAFRGLTRKRFDDIPIDEWDRVMAVNVKGPLLCARAVLPQMLERGYGRIINISSNTVDLGYKNFLQYVTSKSALVGMTSAMARELGGSGITVNALMPTLTQTLETMVSEAVFAAMASLQCIPRPGEPQDIARVIAFLSSPASSFLTGQTLAVDGGAVHR